MLRVALLSAAALVVGISSARAQDPKFTGPDDKARKELPKSGTEWKASAQAGAVITTGNSRTTTITGGASATRRSGDNKLSFGVNGAYARSTIFVANDIDNSGTISETEIGDFDQTTAKNWAAVARYDRFLTDADALYVSGLIGADELAGKDLVGGGQLGYSRQVYKDDKHELIAEAGYDFSYEDLAVGSSLSIHSARVFAGYKATVNKETSLEASLEMLANLNALEAATGEFDAFEDRRTTGLVAINTKLFKNISLRVAFMAKHDSAPAPRPALAIPYEAGFVPAAEKLDTKTEAALIVNFL